MFVFFIKCFESVFFFFNKKVGVKKPRTQKKTLSKTKTSLKQNKYSFITVNSSKQRCSQDPQVRRLSSVTQTFTGSLEFSVRTQRTLCCYGYSAFTATLKNKLHPTQSDTSDNHSQSKLQKDFVSLFNVRQNKSFPNGKQQ